MKITKLREYIKENTVVARSPGRINLIGEHTDYNDGFVLPAAIDRAIYVAATPRNDDEIHLHAIDLNEHFVINVNSINITDVMWANYLLGVIDQFILNGAKARGLELAFTGEIPMGGGLSSSAAVECAVAMALNRLLRADFGKLKLANMARMAEQKFTGVRCGIMDQFASIFGQTNKVIKLDCRSLEYDYIDLNLNDYKIVLYDSNVKHSLASSEYNLRLSQCSAGVEMIARHNPEVKALRDADIYMLEKYVLPNDELIFKRCKYVVEENDRVLKSCEDLKNGDLHSFGQRMFQTHQGLTELYDVSCPELDFLVSSVKNNSNVLGSRMMGGGFGGCTINLVKENYYLELTHNLTKSYKEVMKKQLSVHDVKISNGSSYI